MKNKRILAIHQPNLFPWLGFFDKIRRSELFVYLDHVTNNPRDHLYTKRVRILSNKKEYWLTIPLARCKSRIFLPISEMRISGIEYKKKHLSTLEQSYGKAPFFREVFPLILAFYENADPLIATRNITFIENLCERLDIRTSRVRSSLHNWEKSATDLLIEIVSRFEGTSYMCGSGANGYQDDEKFADRGIELIYQKFVHPRYCQGNSEGFIPGLSVIDTLMNCGFEGTRQLLEKT